MNLSGIPNLLLGDLAGLVPAPGMDVSPLKTLLLNRTGIGDESGDASEYLASCTNLEVLEVAETKMTGRLDKWVAELKVNEVNCDAQLKIYSRSLMRALGYRN